VRVDDATVHGHELAHCNGWPGNHPGGGNHRSRAARRYMLTAHPLCRKCLWPATVPFLDGGLFLFCLCRRLASRLRTRMRWLKLSHWFSVINFAFGPPCFKNGRY